MIDLHCHLLPGIDDGARDLEQALLLARMAVDDGITHCVATPHIHPGRWDNTLASITETFVAFKAKLAEEGIPLQLGMAAEIRLSDEILAMVASGQVPFLGKWEGDRVLLLELPHSHIPPGTEQLIRWLLKQNIRPMIAHPERNKDILRDFNKVLPLARLGCLFQVTAGAVAGDFGQGPEQRAEELLQEDLVTILATDAHHEVRRPPVLDKGRRAAEAIVGESRAWDLVRHNPGRIAAGHFVLAGVEARNAS
ncbi:capsular biosynthesis protein [Microbulbifer flavimaris]|uniref:protein-tyrosine-phosphatase n=1 Tax=Microbulbifer flavimaris TaxID=1781068 RepID=A0ABX4HWY9_9GAMM|nr:MULTISPECIES: CpsB/CapC family capsule biosynthesis tyrosine phosphatase [Microbulbifer]KUJ82428.1 capsular biosynthesis protein [Microbulbifer sp. ZGT114]PCO04632.1 capsular biosynthesis protein [Microbulbifer flavimaris]